MSQMQLDLGDLEISEVSSDIINKKPHTIQEVLAKSPRPNYDHPEVVEYRAVKLAEIVYPILKPVDHDKDEREEFVNELKEAFENYELNEYTYNDSYEVTKMLEHQFGCFDDFLFEKRNEIDGYCSKVNSFIRKKVEEWSKFWKIIPPVKEGDEINFKHKGEIKKCIVQKLYEDEAQVVLYVPGEEYHNSEEEIKKYKLGIIFTYERIANCIVKG